jgi:hypothetical protein
MEAVRRQFDSSSLYLRSNTLAEVLLRKPLFPLAERVDCYFGRH